VFTEYREGEYGLFCSLLITSVMSAMIRFDANMLFMYIFSGFIYAFTVYVAKSVFASMAVHVLYNISMLFLEKYLLRMISQNEYRPLVAFILITLFLVSLIFMLSEGERIFHNEAVLGRDSTKEPEKIDVLKKTFLAVASPTFILCIGVYIAGCILKYFSLS